MDGSMSASTDNNTFCALTYLFTPRFGRSVLRRRTYSEEHRMR